MWRGNVVRGGGGELAVCKLERERRMAGLIILTI
jgi:hypothetical protein